MTKGDAHHLGIHTWRGLALFLLTATGVVVCCFFLHNLLFPITGAITLAVVLWSPFRSIRRRTGPSWAALLIIILLCLAAVLPGFFVARSVTGEAIALVHYVQDGSADQTVQALAAKHAKVGKAIQRLVNASEPLHLESRAAAVAAAALGRVLQDTARGVTAVVLTLFLLFFLLRDGEQALMTFSSLLPLPVDAAHDFMGKLGELIYAIFAGRFLIAGLQGTLAGLAYLVLGVPGSLLWGIATAVCCLVPAMGAFIGWVPIAFYLGLADSWTKALILAAWGSIVVSNIDNVLYPLMVGKRTSLHPAVIFVAIIGGLALFGVSGLVLGPVVVAATMLLLRYWRVS